MHKRVFFFVMMIPLLSLWLNGSSVAAIEKKINKEVVKLTPLGAYKNFVTYANPHTNTYDLIFENTGVFPIELKIKYKYMGLHSHHKEKNYMHHIVYQGEQIDLHTIHFEPCTGNIYLKIKMTSLRKEADGGLFTHHTSGAEGTLTWIEREKQKDAH